MQSQHHFNVADAKQYGVDCAIILYNIRWWLDKNKANHRHLYDGKVWTYNSMKAFAELFPYFSESQIRRRLQKLEDAGVIITGNYNKNKYDQTLWYTVNESDYCNLQDVEIELTKSSNGNDEIVKPIPDNKPYNKPDREKESEPFTAYKIVYEQVTGSGCRAYTTKEREKLVQLEQDFGREVVLQKYKDFLHHIEDYTTNGVGDKSIDWFHKKYDTIGETPEDEDPFTKRAKELGYVD
jgi:hypothetical protein